MFNQVSESPQLCSYYAAQQCLSCPQIEVPYEQQVAEKTARVKSLLPMIAEDAWLPTQESASVGFRNKAKMVVTGSAANAMLGILGSDYAGQDLTECPLYSQHMRDFLKTFQRWIRELGISPYSVKERRGELKYILVTESPDGQFLVRWVLRSHRWVSRLRNFVSVMQEEFPEIAVVSANILAEHVALTEGPEEISLYGDYLPFQLGRVKLQLLPRSFFQTNTFIAHAMYQQAQRWAIALKPDRAVDLFCGVGGFALFLAATCRAVTGVELSAPAIAAAKRGAVASGLENVDFYAADATSFSISEGGLQLTRRDMIVVNPPRRGIGVELANWINESQARVIIYSSCNPVSLAKDMELLGSYKATRARVFDMFPGTDHAEVMVLLVKEPQGNAERKTV
ncbi:putative 23S rRNA (uracil-5-)-methyltransferase RumB [Gleimia coleocanis DSM 15436]|uniref:Putative 23S rRNA (Uracil-5-)-methyltransferase RumB n=1 Tax=Gleimia coleocanis DSM 15436 TaxID=525245 RepID=C0W1I3_9ACTO|nr:methyltransferase domain-containing protein [Gleimia coleocanis]EEH63349.1 putative 23S rRNA (uracil-5-)-methyltransferase RumB [Gleimia coleocanis DSM 15436]